MVYGLTLLSGMDCAKGLSSPNSLRRHQGNDSTGLGWVASPEGCEQVQEPQPKWGSRPLDKPKISIIESHNVFHYLNSQLKILNIIFNDYYFNIYFIYVYIYLICRIKNCLLKKIHSYNIQKLPRFERPSLCFGSGLFWSCLQLSSPKILHQYFTKLIIIWYLSNANRLRIEIRRS